MEKMKRMDSGGASCSTLAALTTQPPTFPSSPPAAGLTRLPSAPRAAGSRGRRSTAMSNYQRLLASLPHWLYGACSSEREQETEQRGGWSERWNSPRGVHSFPARCAPGLRGRRRAFLSFSSTTSPLSSLFLKLQAWQLAGCTALIILAASCLKLEVEQHPPVRITLYDLLLHSATALRKEKRQQKQEVWATLDRELVRGGMSRSATGEDERKRKNKGERERNTKQANKPGCTTVRLKMWVSFCETQYATKT